VIRRVDVARAVYGSANERFGETRSAGGEGSEYDFVGGPLAAAVFAFRDFRRAVVRPRASGALVHRGRPDHGVVTFAAVLRTDDIVEVVSFVNDPGCWAALDDDPE
jgi:hypothetical protein